MFLPVWFYVVWAAIVVAGGALLGTFLGRVIGLRKPPHARHPRSDAAAGGAALFLLNVAINVADSHVTYRDGRALGSRGVLLNHKLLWAVVVIGLAVSARHLLARRAGRRARPLPPKDLGAALPSDH
jgi:hypothetical protein